MKCREGGKTLSSLLEQSPKPGDFPLGWILAGRTSKGRELHAGMLHLGQVPKGGVKVTLRLQPGGVLEQI